MKKNDPYNDIKTYHLADKINPNGQVSALCFVRPRSIGANQRWTTDMRAVTCKKCIRQITATQL